MSAAREAAEASGARASRPAGAAPRPMDATAAGTMILLCAMWGVGQAAIKIGNTGMSPLWQAGLRSVCAALVLIAWMRLRGIPLRPAPGMARWGLLMGAVFALEFVFLYPGISLTLAARGTVLLYTAPFFVAIGAHFVLGDRLTPSRVAGLLLAFGGVVVALADRGGGGGGGDWRGDLMCLAAGAMWALTTLIVKASPLVSQRPERTLLDQLIVSAPLLFGASWIAGETGLFAPSPAVWMAFAYQVAIASFSYLGWFMMVQRHSPASVSAFTFLTPLFGVGFAALLLGEPLTPALVVAAALIAAGIWLVNRR